MRKLSAGDALRVASQSVSIWGAGAHWTVCYPWDKRDPAGPNTTHTCTSYGMARLSAARIKANIALALLGLYDNDTAADVYSSAGSARQLVSRALRGALRRAVASAPLE